MVFYFLRLYEGKFRQPPPLCLQLRLRYLSGGSGDGGGVGFGDVGENSSGRRIHLSLIRTGTEDEKTDFRERS